MSVKKRRLGRGLDALLGEVRKDDRSGAPANRDSLREVPIDMLHRGQYQPRTHMDPDALAELALSIKARGVVQPIIARPTEAGQFEIIAGERRWRAAQSAGLETVPVLVREIADDAALAVALIENIQRENLNPIDHIK